jgi:hypothetical protein
MARRIGRAGTASARTTSPRQRPGIATHRCSTDGPPTEPISSRARVISEGVFGSGFAQPVAIAHAAGPISIGDSERRAVRVPRGHADGTACQMRQRRRQGTRSEKDE